MASQFSQIMSMVGKHIPEIHNENSLLSVCRGGRVDLLYLYAPVEFQFGGRADGDTGLLHPPLGFAGVRRAHVHDVAGLVAVTMADFGVVHAPFPAENVTTLVSATGGAALAAIGIVGIRAASVELLFRGVVQDRLRGALSRRRSILVTAVLVALVHVPLVADGSIASSAVTVVSLFGLALLWGWVYERSRSVPTAIFCRAVFAAVLIL